MENQFKTVYSFSMKSYSYTAHIEASPEGGYWSRVPALAGCFSQGETIEETIQNTKEAIELYLEGYAEEGKDVPEESDLSVSVRIPVTV
jgi:predicted RNase H-like HicB family nuclease